MHMWTSLSLFN